MKSPLKNRPIVMISGDFREGGGQDIANYYLARHLVLAGHPLYLVCHTETLQRTLPEQPIKVVIVPKPLGSYFLGEFVLERQAQQLIRSLKSQRPIVIANGGNFKDADINWVHFVHSASELRNEQMNFIHRFKAMSFRRRERVALGSSRQIVADSAGTAAAIDKIIRIKRTTVIYYGCLSPPPRDSHIAIKSATFRRQYCLSPNDTVISFIGALGQDRRKGFDALFEAFQQFKKFEANACTKLLVAGDGSDRSHWMTQSKKYGLESSITFLGHFKDIPILLANTNVLVAPSRYEPYGLAAQEAILSGVPVIITNSAGVVEQFSPPMRELSLNLPVSTADLLSKLLLWSTNQLRFRQEAEILGEKMRHHTWTTMGEEFQTVIANLDDGD